MSSIIPGPVAQTTWGPVKGFHNNSALSFMGVRYGADAGAGGRFLPPRDPRPWTETLDATRPGPAAPQILRRDHHDPFYAWYSAVGDMGEDCLFLNVHTPALDGAKRPVMVWIHGGGWCEFSGNAAGFDGSRLAFAEDVVVISVNHRLGVLGYLSLPDAGPAFASSGNAGLLDLLQALRWARDNAAAFGGDPDNVTIFGESGGASKVVALASMPAAQGLFHKAIVQSSGGGLTLATPEEAAGYAAAFKAALGNPDITAQELQRLPVASLLEAYGKARCAFRGTIDGVNVLDHPLLPAGLTDAAPASTPMMFGFTSDEASYYFHLHAEIVQVDRETAGSRLSRYLGVSRNEVELLLQDYLAADPDLTPVEMMIRVASDHQFTLTNLELAERQVRNAPGNVFVYSFDYPSAREGLPWGAPHTSELPYIFGTLDAAEAMIGRSDNHQSVSRMMMRTWAAFARNGTPSNDLVREWRPYDAQHPWVMSLGPAPELRLMPRKGALQRLGRLPPAGYAADRNLLFGDP